MSDEESDDNHEESSPAYSLSEDVDDSIVINESSDEEIEGKLIKTVVQAPNPSFALCAIVIAHKAHLQ